MAPFLSRLFGLRKRATKQITEKDDVRIPHVDLDCSLQIRVMLFRERFGQERRLLFDSKAVRKKDNASLENLEFQTKRMKENSVEKSFKLSAPPEKDIVYEWQKQSPDEQMLREMIFGSVSTSYQGITIKVHIIRSPFQVMISIVFPAPSVSEFRSGEDLEKSGNSASSAYDILISKNNESAQIHIGSFQSVGEYISLPTYLDVENQSSSLSLPRSGSYNNLQRRLLRNKATSIQLGLQKMSDESQTEEFNRIPGQSRVKLGLSVVISLDDTAEERQFQDFLFTHIALIENHLMMLRTVVNEAYLDRRKFVLLLYDGSRKLQQSIQDLYTAPRLQFPEWLSIISCSNHLDLSDKFMQKFTHILKEYDKKETNFFVSTLLTAVLTHHLAWVPTIIPTDGKVTDGLRSDKHVPLWVSMLAKSRPYNPLWVQIGDLYGSISKLCKVVKIVVKGSDSELILIFLQVLSYFVRCSDICEPVVETIQLASCDGDIFDHKLPSAENTGPSLYKNFGWSLMAGVSDHYLKDFCLQGVKGPISPDEIKKDLHDLTKVHILDEPISEAVCILVDTDSWVVQIQSSNWSENDLSGLSSIRVGMSSLVGNICESVLNVKELGLPSESCIIFLEDRLQELYCQSLKLSEYVRCNQMPSSIERIASALNLDASDVPLLLAVATTHSPNLSIFKL